LAQPIEVAVNKPVGDGFAEHGLDFREAAEPGDELAGRFTVTLLLLFRRPKARFGPLARLRQF
jgi:hypothetical protein